MAKIKNQESKSTVKNREAVSSKGKEVAPPVYGIDLADTPVLQFKKEEEELPRKKRLQTKLKVGKPGDRFEQEADAIADQVMQMGSHVQLKGKLEEEKKMVQPKSTNPTTEAPPGLDHRLEASRGKGSALPPNTLSFMNQTFGADFSGVRVHHDSEAVQLNQQLSAKAFTHGRDVFFNQGEYQPESSGGKRLLAHELVHVVQQKGSPKISDWINLEPQKGHPYRYGDSTWEIDFEIIAETLYELLEIPGADEEVAIILEPFSGEFGNIKKLMEAYKKLNNTNDDSIFENHLRAGLSKEGFSYVWDILQKPQKVNLGIAERLLKEAEQNNKPGGACSIESLKRYVRAYLDYYYLDGALYRSEELRRKSPRSSSYRNEKEQLEEKLSNLLGGKSLGKKFLDGGPNGSKNQKIDAIILTLVDSGIFANYDKALAFSALWNIYETSEVDLPGASKALAQEGFGERLTLPWVNEEKIEKYNIKEIIWDEVLKPGALIQTYQGVPINPATGHSFIFVEYVYSTSESPPLKNRDQWELYGASGVPLNREGKIVKEKKKLDKINGVFLVGMRIIDQNGYKFLAKNPSFSKPGQHRQGLARSQVWFASNLIEKTFMEFEGPPIQGTVPRREPFPIENSGVISARHESLMKRPKITEEKMEEYGIKETLIQEWERRTSEEGISKSLARYKDSWVHIYRNIIKIAANENEIPDWVLGGVAWTEVGGEPAWTDSVGYSLGDLGLKKKEKVSFGPVAIQIARAAEELGYDSDNLLPIQMSLIIDSLRDPQQNLFIVASHLHRCKNMESPGKPPELLTADDIRIIGARYNRGVDISLNAILNLGKKTEYGDDLVKKQWRIKKLLKD